MAQLVLLDDLSYPLAGGQSFRRTLDPGYPPVLVSEAEDQVNSYLPHQTVLIPAGAGLGRYRPRGDEPLSPNLVWDMWNINPFHGFFTLGPLKQEITNKPSDVVARYSRIQRIGNELYSMERHDDRAISYGTANARWAYPNEGEVLALVAQNGSNPGTGAEIPVVINTGWTPRGEFVATPGVAGSISGTLTFRFTGSLSNSNHQIRWRVKLGSDYLVDWQAATLSGSTNGATDSASISGSASYSANDELVLEIETRSTNTSGPGATVSEMRLDFSANLSVRGEPTTASNRPLVYGGLTRADSTIQVDVSGWDFTQAVVGYKGRVYALASFPVGGKFMARADDDGTPTSWSEFGPNGETAWVFGDLAIYNSLFAVLYAVSAEGGTWHIKTINPESGAFTADTDDGHLDLTVIGEGTPRYLIPFTDASGQPDLWASVHEGLYQGGEQRVSWEHRDAFNTGKVVRANLPQDCLVFCDGPNLYCGSWSSGSFVVTQLGPHGIDDGFPADSFGNITDLLFVREGGNAGWLLAAVGGDDAYPSIYVYDVGGNRWGRLYKGETQGRVIRSMGNTRTSAGVSILVFNEDNNAAGTDTTPFRFENFVENPLLVDGYKYAEEGVVRSMRLNARTPVLGKGWKTFEVDGEGLSSDERVRVKIATEFDRESLGNPADDYADITEDDGRVWLAKGGDGKIALTEERAPGVRAKAIQIEAKLERGSDDELAPVLTSMSATFKPHAGALSYLTMVLDFTKGHRGKQPRQLIDELIATIDKAGAEDIKVVLSPQEEYWGASDRETISNFQASAENTFLGGALPSDWRGLCVVQFKEVFADDA